MSLKRRLRRQRRSRRGHSTALTLDAFFRERKTPPHIARALRDALPGGVLPTASHLVGGIVERTHAATGLRVEVLLDVLRDFAAWCYARDPARQIDLALHVAQNELLRRAHGAAPRTVTFGDPPSGAPLTDDEVRRVIVQWEAQSFAMGLERPEDGADERVMRYCVALAVVGTLAETDGVPARLEHLDPDALYDALEDGPDEIEGIARPEGYAALMLDGAAELYARLIEHGALEPRAGRALIARLRALAALADDRHTVAVA